VPFSSEAIDRASSCVKPPVSWMAPGRVRCLHRRSHDDGPVQNRRDLVSGRRGAHGPFGCRCEVLGGRRRQLKVDREAVPAGHRTDRLRVRDVGSVKDDRAEDVLARTVSKGHAVGAMHRCHAIGAGRLRPVAGRAENPPRAGVRVYQLDDGANLKIHFRRRCRRRGRIVRTGDSGAQDGDEQDPFHQASKDTDYPKATRRES